MVWCIWAGRAPAEGRRCQCWLEAENMVFGVCSLKIAVLGPKNDLGCFLSPIGTSSQTHTNAHTHMHTRTHTRTKGISHHEDTPRAKCPLARRWTSCSQFLSFLLETSRQQRSAYALSCLLCAWHVPAKQKSGFGRPRCDAFQIGGGFSFNT